MSKTVYLGMSGGVDSSVSALLLKQQGYNVVGVYMKCWEGLPTKTGLQFTETCDWEAERRDALRVATQLDIPFRTYDFVKEYREDVIEYFFAEYAAGRTPNPDVMCNRFIKFDRFLKRALTEGADYVATGHYARRVETDKARLLMGRDSNKDQTYFLWTITAEALAHSLFPVGDLTKAEVRELAAKANLPVATKKDSQGICFVGQVPVHEFIAARLPEKIGVVKNLQGEILGEHTGAHFYTVGQRHGFTLRTLLPHYVVGTDVQKNEVYVVAGNSDAALYKTTVQVKDWSWVYETPKDLSTLTARIRYRQPAQLVHSLKIEQNLMTVQFAAAQRAVTAGQSIVFYEGQEMIGGGIIV